MATHLATFTPKDGSPIEFLTFEYDGDFEFLRQYRDVPQNGPVGGFTIPLNTLPREISSLALIKESNFQTLKENETKEGALNRLGEIIDPIRLVSVVRVASLEPLVGLAGEMITNNPGELEIEVRFKREVE